LTPLTYGTGLLAVLVEADTCVERVLQRGSSSVSGTGAPGLERRGGQ
jgi:hypothetical protein